nr:hypothetical protein [Tanacetum cinerariifolium]
KLRCRIKYRAQKNFAPIEELGKTLVARMQQNEGPYLAFHLRASDHMSPHLHLFHSIRVLKRPIKIRLPDGTSKCIKKVGHIRINSSLTLHNVFYVPDFKVNLLSVGEIASNSKPYCSFPSYYVCFLGSTKKALTVGQGFHNLYICKPSSDAPIKVPSIPVLSSFVNKEAHLYNVTLDLFHARIGHTSVSKLIHVPECKHHNTKQLSCETCLLAKHVGI